MVGGVNWRDINIALEVYKYRSLKAAASKLRITESTASRRVRALEDTLGIVLFERGPGGMVATPAGLSLFDHAILAEGHLEKGIEAALGSQAVPSGCVRVTTVPILANYVLAGEAAGLIETFPNLELDIVGISAELSLLRREADIALRLARPVNEAENITRKLGMLKYGVFAAESLVGRQPDTATIPWVNYNNDMAHLPQAKWITQFTRHNDEPICAVTCNDAEGLLGMVKAGHGKSILPRRVASHFPELAELSVAGSLPEREIWLIVHPNIAQTQRIRVVIDWLATVFGDHVNTQGP